MRVPFEPGVSRLALDVGGVISLVDTDAARGWNRVVRSALNPSHLLRLDEATIEWRLPQFAGAAAVAVAEPADCAGDHADRVQPSPAPSPRA